MQRFLSLVGLLSLVITQAHAQDTTRRRVDSVHTASPDSVHPVSPDSARTLTRVTVTGTKPAIQRQLDKTVVNIDRLITSEGSTVLETMQHLPGVQVTADGEVSINGKSGVNVYIDGKPTHLSAADLAALLSGISASSIQKIEIMTNPPARYDASGTASIINIVRKKNRKPGFNGTVNGSLIQGHYGRYTGGITAGYKDDHINLFFNDTYTYNRTLFGRHVTSDILDANQSLLTEEVSDNPNTTTRRTDRPTAGIDWYASARTTLSLSATGGFGSFDDATISGLDIYDGNKVRTNHEDFTSRRTDHPYNYTTTFQWAQQLDTLGQAVTIDLDYSGFTNHPVQANRGTLYDTSHNFIGETDALLLQYRGLHIYSAQADYTHPFRNGHWEAGLKSSCVRIGNDNSYYDQYPAGNSFDTAQSDYSLYTEQVNAAYFNIQRSWKKWETQAGLRAEAATTIGKDDWKGQNLTRQYRQLFPTLFLQYKPDPRQSFTLRTGRRTERPDYSEMIPFRRPLTPTLFFQGNPNLRPHLSWHEELGWSWNNAFSITAGLDQDHDYMQTLPYLDSNKTTITRRPTNVQAHSWNIDLTWSKKMTPWWSTDITLSFYRNAFSGQAGGYTLTDPGMVSVFGSINNSFRISDRLSAEADWEYNSERRLVTSRFGPYSLLDLGIKQMIWKEKGSISINAHNIFQSEGHNVIDRYEGLYQYSNVYFYTRSVSLNLLYRFGSGKTIRTKTRSSSEEEQNRAGN